MSFCNAHTSYKEYTQDTLAFTTQLLATSTHPHSTTRHERVVHSTPAQRAGTHRHWASWAATRASVYHARTRTHVHSTHRPLRHHGSCPGTYDIAVRCHRGGGNNERRAAVPIKR